MPTNNVPSQMRQEETPIMQIETPRWSMRTVGSEHDVDAIVPYYEEDNSLWFAVYADGDSVPRHRIPSSAVVSLLYRTETAEEVIAAAKQWAMDSPVGKAFANLFDDLLSDEEEEASDPS